MGKKVSDTLLVCDKVDSQGDYFPREAVEAAVAEFNAREFRTATLGYSNQVQDVMGMVSQLTMDSGTVTADVEFFEDERKALAPHNETLVTPAQVADLVEKGKLAYGLGGNILKSAMQSVQGRRGRARVIKEFEIIQVGIVDAKKKVT